MDTNEESRSVENDQSQSKMDLKTTERRYPDQNRNASQGFTVNALSQTRSDDGLPSNEVLSLSDEKESL